MPDLDQLSREVAAAGDEWMVPGVEVITPRGTVRRIHAVGLPFGAVAGMTRHGSRTVWKAIAGTRPNLRDPVTVNAMLGNGVVYQAVDDLWNANCGQDSTTWAAASDRTAAICRAWIAARGKQ